MRKKLLISFIFFSNFLFSQITIYENVFTPDELIQNVLIGNPNFPVSNIVMVSGIDFSSVNSIAYFDNVATDLPFNQGVVLSTGDVLGISGPNINTLSSGNSTWLGDSDLETINSISSTFNASLLQFDFIAQVPSISLDFLMASEEYYGPFECNFADSFAFIVSDNTTGLSENIAVVPGTSTPISVVNVNGSNLCGAPNVEYFNRYNYDMSAYPGVPYILAENSPINLNGQTVPFVLTTNLDIGHSYTIKIVLADATDTIYDTVLFVRYSSFGAYPVIDQEPSNIVVEDTDNDGFSVFNLRINEAQMLGSVDTSIYSFDFTYYLSLADAESQTNSIQNPESYINVSDVEDIFVNMKNPYTGANIVDSFKIAINGSLLSIEESSFNELFKVFPNPVVNELNITSKNQNVNTVEVYNLQGKLLVSESNMVHNNMKLDFSRFSKGIYLLKINSSEGTIFKRIVK